MKNMDFHRRFQPLTARPFSQDSTYREAPPSPALAPFVRCFWGSSEEFSLSAAGLYTDRLIIPDTCVDMIIQTDEHAVRCRFCGLDQEAYRSDMTAGTCAVFAVRLYFWAVPFLIQEEARCMAIPVSSCEAYFPGIETYLEEHDFASCSFQGKTALLERYLLGRLDTEQVPVPLLNSVDFLLKHHGSLSVKELTEHSVVSSRTLERMFKRHLGMQPKKLADLVRYQVLWRHALTRPDFQIQDEVFELGFYDQAHLLNTFRRYHGMGLGEALEYSFPSLPESGR